ncbi:DUF4234 domain-containing protein [Acidipropionibacterium acidipropionici]|nr:DUF4234 domain-containing protein [Acidipropionibacterium acidipropionici]AZP38714.1 DUF4234 domain-containing protein [Acidipropionibacterium acidipropionici]
MSETNPTHVNTVTVTTASGPADQLAVAHPIQAPVGQVKTNRSLSKFIILSIITLGIYDLFLLAEISGSLNIMASRYDGKKTMNFWLLLFVVGPITAGIAYIVWMHKMCNRIGAELVRRGHPRQVSAATYWGWGVLGAFIIVGPFVLIWKLLHSMNALAADYNIRG